MHCACPTLFKGGKINQFGVTQAHKYMIKLNQHSLTFAGK